MRSMMMNALVFVAVSSAATAQAGTLRTGAGPCADASQCQSGLCLEIGGDSYCSQTCGSCPSGMQCNAQVFQHAGLSVCLGQPDGERPELDGPPRMPCRTDRQCSGGTVCAESMGQRSCTPRCRANAQCEMPEMFGIKMDFMTCRPDEARPSRKACLPKKKCMNNPNSCMQMNAGGFLGAIGGMVKFTADVSAGFESTVERNAPAEPAAPRAAASTPPEPQAMSKARFARLLQQVEQQSFEEERNEVLRVAAAGNYLTCKQVGAMMGTVSFADEKLSALRILAPRIVDAENHHILLEQFSFDDEKTAARRILND